jgi:hypothetical protein
MYIADFSDWKSMMERVLLSYFQVSALFLYQIKSNSTREKKCARLPKVFGLS